MFTQRYPARSDVENRVVLPAIVVPRNVVVVERDQCFGLPPRERRLRKVGRADDHPMQPLPLQQIDLGVRDRVLDDKEAGGFIHGAIIDEFLSFFGQALDTHEAFVQLFIHDGLEPKHIGGVTRQNAAVTENTFEILVVVVPEQRQNHRYARRIRERTHRTEAPEQGVPIKSL